jgi:hypothetical protein
VRHAAARASSARAPGSRASASRQTAQPHWRQRQSRCRSAGGQNVASGSPVQPSGWARYRATLPASTTKARSRRADFDALERKSETMRAGLKFWSRNSCATLRYPSSRAAMALAANVNGQADIVLPLLAVTDDHQTFRATGKRKPKEAASRLRRGNLLRFVSSSGPRRGFSGHWVALCASYQS